MKNYLSIVALVFSALTTSAFAAHPAHAQHAQVSTTGAKAKMSVKANKATKHAGGHAKKGKHASRHK